MDETIKSFGHVAAPLQTGRPAAGAPGAAGCPAAGLLPCLLPITQPGKDKQPLGNKSQIARKAETLFVNLEDMVTRYGIEFCGFWTATFAENITSRKVAERRFNSFATHVLREIFSEYISVPERQDRGAIHYHLTVALRVDIRSGFDFEAYKAARDFKKTGYRGGGRWLPGYQQRFKQAERLYAASPVEVKSPFLPALFVFHLCPSVA